MKSEFVTAIWVAKFDNERELADYLEWNYSADESEDLTCKFSKDTALSFFDEGFLEYAYVGSSAKILTMWDNISYIENFKDELLKKISSVNLSDSNSIIALSGKRSIHGDINAELFDFKSQTNDKVYLQFVGVFKFDLTE